MSDVWNTLITAVTGLGGVGLGLWGNPRSERAKASLARSMAEIDRRRALYVDFLRESQAQLRHLNRSQLYYAHGAPQVPAAQEMMDRGAETLVSLQAAYAAVVVGGSAEARAAADKVYEASGKVSELLSVCILSNDRRLAVSPDVDAAFKKLDEELETFISVVRDELARDEGSAG